MKVNLVKQNKFGTLNNLELSTTTLSALNLTINCPAAPKKRAIPFIKGGVLNISLIKITDQSIPAPSINIADKVKNTRAIIFFEGITNKEGFSFNVGRIGATTYFLVK